MEIINQTILKQKCSFKDWGIYREEYVDVLGKQLCKLFSNAHEHFCKQEGKLIGRDSWMGHERTIKPNKTEYIYEFWNMENIEEFSFGFHSTKGEIIGKLIVDIKWTK